jgi:hypothetical protein
MNDEFYIGWEAKPPSSVGKNSRRLVVLILLLGFSTAITLACAQRLIGKSVFEWGRKKTFSGILKADPYPHLLVLRPGKSADLPLFSSYYLVAPWKFGLQKEKITAFDGKSVSLTGTLIYRDNQTMIEVQPDSIISSPDIPQWPEVASQVKAQQSQTNTRLPVTLKGEIVDSKCFLGVMNPGQLTPHRACAIRCISGGVPPVLLVRAADRPAMYFLLVSTDGKPVNKQVLDLVAEPVEITGQIEYQGELMILRADPTTYRRL